MKKLKTKIINLNLNYKKEITKITLTIIIVNFLIAFLVIYLKTIKLLIFAFLATFLILYIFNVNYDKRIISYKQSLENEFVTTLNYIQTYLSNGYNVYQSINEILEICNDNLNKLFMTLLADIDEDKSVTPFITFANNFSSSLIQQVMISLYLMVENGTDITYISRFTPLFSQLKKDNEQKIIKNINSRYDSLNLLPVVGAAIITIIIIIGIVSIIGGMLNGI